MSDFTSFEQFLMIILLVALSLVTLGVIHFALGKITADPASELAAIEHQIEAAQKLSMNSQNSKPAWDIARLTLEKQFSESISQNASIYKLSVSSMIVGFLLIVTGSALIYMQPNSLAPGLIAAIGGTLSEFIGATFLLLYRSTNTHIQNHIKTLERINSVGMAMQILDSIPEDTTSGNLKSLTKTDLIKSVILGTYAVKETDSKG